MKTDKEPDSLRENRLCAVMGTKEYLAEFILKGEASRGHVNGKEVRVVRVVPGQVPDDTVVVSVQYMIERGAFYIVITSATFDRVKPGTSLPEINLQLESFEAIKK